MRRPRQSARRAFRARTRAVGCAIALLAGCASGCAGDFDLARTTPARGTLGREMYTLVCDRVGAQALREDLNGSSYHDVCHADASGVFASTTVDASRLPPLDPDALDIDGRPVPLERQATNRAHRIARVEALARRREDLVSAFDDAFTNEIVRAKDLASASPADSCSPKAGPSSDADLRTELSATLGRMSELYDDDTIPHFTRAIARVATDVDSSEEARRALARFDGRQGYRPSSVAVGLVRPLLAYPRLVELSNALFRLLAADTDPLGIAGRGPALASTSVRDPSGRVPGPAHDALVDLFAAMRAELRTAKESAPAVNLVATPDAIDPAFVRLNRPRGNLEIARALFLGEAPAFAVGGEPQWLVRRDARGFAKVPLSNGTVPPPFVDADGPTDGPDGLPDVDIVGRFVTKDAAKLPTPFRVFGEPTAIARARDRDGKSSAYEYVDVSKTFLAAALRDVVPLVDPEPERRRETLMDFVGGLAVVSGARTDTASSTRTYPAANGAEAVTLKYRGYDGATSPLVDLVHAVGQILADPRTEDTLSLVHTLAKERPQVLARIVGVALELKEIADRHPEASIPAASTFWDETFDVLSKMAEKPKLIEDLVRALGSESTVELRRAGIGFLTRRDELTYDRRNLNGPPYNLTTSSVESLVTPVDRGKPDSGDNRSVFQRFLQVLHDVNGLSICTKEGAVAHIVWKGASLDFPSTAAKSACVTLTAENPRSPSPVCGLFRIKNVAEEIVNAIVGEVTLDIRDDCLRKVVGSSLTGVVGGSDAFLASVSGIDGFTTKPTIPGLSRLVFFDLPHDGHPGDTQNAKTLRFLQDLFDEHATAICPTVPFTDTDGAVLNLRQCASRNDSLRVRDANALFPLETLGFLESMKPLALAFRQNDANMAFVDLFDTFHRHWGSSGQSTSECDPAAKKTDARWCAQDGAVSYEPLLADLLATDLLPMIRDTVKELETLPVEHCTRRDARGRCVESEAWDGVKVLTSAVRGLVSASENAGLKQRDGTRTVKRNDGSPNPQVTPIYLLVDALKGFDRRLAEHAAAHPEDDRTGLWRRARSRLVDQFLAVSGTTSGSKLANPAIAEILPTVVTMLRSQLAAHCPDPANGCSWARSDFPRAVEDTLTGPTFAGILGVLDGVRADPAARTELERLVVRLLQAGEDETSATTVTALADLLQVLEDDKHVTALMRATAEAAGPEVVDASGHVVSRGLFFSAIEVLSRVLGEARDAEGTRLCSREIDPNRTVPIVLRKLVTPRTNGAPSPAEVLLDVVADVNRLHPAETTKLDAADYGSIAREVADFCAHPSRGLEQVYALLKEATTSP